MPSRFLALAFVLFLSTMLAPLRAGAETRLRVIAQSAKVRSGPGTSYRVLDSVRRGESFVALERARTGFWFRIELADGTPAWISGERVHNVAIAESGSDGFFARIGTMISDTLLAPSPVTTSSVELSVSAGVLDQEGVFIFRPAWLIDPHFAIEAFAGLSPRQQEDLFLAGGGLTLRLLPGAPVGPFVHIGVGAAHLRPKADNFTQGSQSLFAMEAGGGFEITLKQQITLRIDARNWTLFDPNQASNGQEYSGGMAIFF